MSGIEKITSRIKKDAEIETEAALAEAKREAEEVMHHFAAEATKQSGEAKRRGAASADERFKRLEGVAELEAGKNLLAAKQEIINSAFSRAAEAISKLPDDKYLEFLSKLAANYSLTGTEQIFLSKNDLDKYGAKVLSAANAALAAKKKHASLTLSNVAAEIDGGLILKEGDVETNCSLGTIMHLTRARLTSDVANLLFN